MSIIKATLIWAVGMLSLALTAVAANATTVNMNIVNNDTAVFIGTVVIADMNSTSGIQMKPELLKINQSFPTMANCKAFVVNFELPIADSEFGSATPKANILSSWTNSDYWILLGKCYDKNAVVQPAQ